MMAYNTMLFHCWEHVINFKQCYTNAVTIQIAFDLSLIFLPSKKAYYNFYNANL